MTMWGSNLDQIFLRVWDVSIGASAVIAVVLLVRATLRKAPRICSYLLWAVVLIRLLCPVGIGVAWGIVPSVDTAEAYTLVNDEVSFIDAADAALRAVGDAANGGLGVQKIRTTSNEIVTSQWWEVWVLFGKYVWIAGVFG